MKLVVVSNQDLDKLEKLATELFTPVVNKDVVVPELNNPPAYDESNLGTLYRFVPIKDKDIISFYWFLPFTT